MTLVRGAWRLALVVLLAGPLAGQGRTFTAERYLDLSRVESPRISPDGKQILFTRWQADRRRDRWSPEVWLMDADGGHARLLEHGSSPEWSPDGSRIAFLAETAGKPQLWVRWLGGAGELAQVTQGEASPGAFKWSPDGKSIAFAMTVPIPPAMTIAMPAPPDSAHWSPSPLVVDRPRPAEGAVHLFVVAVDSGTQRDLTPSGFGAGARGERGPEPPVIEWMPDSRTILVDGSDETETDRAYRASNIYAIDVVSAMRRKVVAQPGFWANPVLSPDGKSLAYTGFPATPNSYQARDIYVARIDGMGGRNVTPGLDRDAASLMWADNETVWFTIEDRGSVNSWTTSTTAKVPGAKPASNGAHVIRLGSISRKGGFGVVVRSSPQQPAEINRFTLKKPSQFVQLSHLNATVAGLQLGESEEIQFRAADGTLLQGWVIKPPEFDQAKKYPLVLEVHGGPHAMEDVGFSPMRQGLASAGNLVLSINPHGSTGYGTAFGNATMKAHPGVDYDDLMLGVNEVIGRGWVDTTRMYVSGCDGALSSWIIGHTARFAAAALRCPVVDWASLQADPALAPMVQDNFFWPSWRDPVTWLKLSPISYTDSVTTPTLLMTDDLRRTSQAEEFFGALTQHGVPAALVTFSGEYRGVAASLSNWMRVQQYMVEWFAKHVRSR